MDGNNVINNITQLFNSLYNILNNGRDNVLCFPVPKTGWNNPLIYPKNWDIQTDETEAQCKNNNDDLRWALVDFIEKQYNDYTVISNIFSQNSSNNWYETLKTLVGDDLTKYLYPKILAVLYNKDKTFVNINCYLNYPNNVDMKYITDLGHRPPYIPGSGITYPAGFLSDVKSYYDEYNYSCRDHNSLYNKDQQVALTVTNLLNTGLTPPPPPPSFSSSSTYSRFSTRSTRYLAGVL
jgi:hypothetical protein